MDRDFDMQTRTAVLQPRVCQIAVRLYVHCMIVVARPYYTIVLMERTALSVYLYGRCSAIILYTVSLGDTNTNKEARWDGDP